jgi:hypothetical protein
LCFKGRILELIFVKVRFQVLMAASMKIEDLKLSWQLNSIKSSWATSRVNSGQKPNVSEAEMVSKTLDLCPELTRLVAREDFIKYEDDCLLGCCTV